MTHSLIPKAVHCCSIVHLKQETPTPKKREMVPMKPQGIPRLTATLDDVIIHGGWYKSLIFETPRFAHKMISVRLSRFLLPGITTRRVGLDTLWVPR